MTPAEIIRAYKRLVKIAVLAANTDRHPEEGHLSIDGDAAVLRFEDDGAGEVHRLTLDTLAWTDEEFEAQKAEALRKYEEKRAAEKAKKMAMEQKDRADLVREIQALTPYRIAHENLQVNLKMPHVTREDAYRMFEHDMAKLTRVAAGKA